MDLLSGEAVIYRGFGLVVTNQRLIFQSEGSVDLRTATIDCVGLCRYSTHQKLWALVLGVLFVLVGIGVLLRDSNSAGVGFVFIGLLLIGLYFITKRSELRIYAGGSLIPITITGHHADELQDAINAIQKSHLDFVTVTTH